MLKNILYSLIISLTFSGCYNLETSSDTNTTQDIPQYDQVIARLEGTASTPQEYFELANAYMEKSGLVLSDVIQDISDSAQDADSPFMAFVQSVQPSSGEDATSMEDLNKATDYEMMIIGDRCDEDENLTDFEKDVCLYKGLTQTMNVANTINSLSDDVSKIETQGDAKLQASSCAMQYAFNGVINGCSITETGPVTFEQSGATYDSIAVYSNGKEYEYLLHRDDTTHTRELIITDGYCSTDDFNTREVTLSDASYYPCPVTTKEGETPVTANNNLVDSLNEGTDAILAVSDNYEELAQTVKEFKIEISAVGDDNKVVSDTIITVDTDNANINGTDINMQDMIEYLNEQNNLAR
jgi:hypothetical protein